MTLKEAYRWGRNKLRAAGVESFSLECRYMFEHCFAVCYDVVMIRGDKIADDEKLLLFHKCVAQRVGGRPIQYILGEWSFMDHVLEICEGVLIPRDDTEVLVNEAVNRIKGIEKPCILDLCSGSGAVAIALGDIVNESQVVAVEVCDKAFEFLCKNIKKYSQLGIAAVKMDILNFPISIARGDTYKLAGISYNFSGFDVITANPPYIKSDDIVTLQTEVQREPRIALDGGADGLKFYRHIATNWKSMLKPGAYLCVEVGFGQAGEVAEILERAGFIDIRCICDINGIERVVSGQVLY